MTTDNHAGKPKNQTFAIAQNSTKSSIVENFAIHIWFSALFAVSFSGAVFGLYGLSASLAMLIIGFGLSFMTLYFAYTKRSKKDALKIPADAIAILGLIIFFVTLFELGLVVALVEMLFFLQLSLNLYFREHRQIYFGLIACFVALMSGAVYTFSAGYLVFMLLFCLFACFYLALCFVDKKINDAVKIINTNRHLNRLADSSHADSNKVVYSRDVIGSWRYIERIGLAVFISVIAGLIYLLMPQFTAGNLGQLPLKGFDKYENTASQDQILPEHADLTQNFYKTPTSSTISNDNAHKANSNETHGGGKQPNKQNDANQALSEVKQNSKNASSEDKRENNKDSRPTYLWDNDIYFYIKSSRMRYLKLQTKTYFDGASWYALQYGFKKLPSSPNNRYMFSLYSDKPTESIDITVAKDLPKDVGKLILTTDNTVSLSFPSSWVARDYYNGLKTATNLKKDTFYQLHVNDTFNQNGQLTSRQAKPDIKDLQLPASLDPRIAELATSIVNPTDSNWQKAQKLEHHLRNSYEYTLDTLYNQNNIPLTDFLFDTKRGHCEYFATALAVMLRLEGIPARMVTGFVAQDYNPVTGYFEVKGMNGHAWVSAYVDGYWIILEASGAYRSPTQSQDQNTAHTTNTAIKDYLERVAEQNRLLEHTGSQSISFYEKLKEWLYAFWYAIVSALQWLWHVLEVLLKRYGWLLGVMLCLALIVFKVYKKYRLYWLDKYGLNHVKKHSAQNQGVTANSVKIALAFYMQHYQAMLARHGIYRPKGQTIEHFTACLVRKGFMQQHDADRLISLINAYYYHDKPIKNSDMTSFLSYTDINARGFGVKVGSADYKSTNYKNTKDTHIIKTGLNHDSALVEARRIMIDSYELALSQLQRTPKMQ